MVYGSSILRRVRPKLAKRSVRRARHTATVTKVLAVRVVNPGNIAAPTETMQC